ncbi:MAG: GerAB/ArcD/ProY family transporter [Clostridia bacterium]|nr:GerAB/ArcD/ProY family transporter [Clostridia bacterium]
MKEKTVYFTHQIALYSLFIMGNAVIDLPQKSADEFTFLGFLVTVVLSLSVNLVLTLLICRLFSTEKASSFKKTVATCVAVLVAIFALWCAADTFSDFISFVGKVILPRVSPFLITLLFLLLALFFITRSKEASLKFSLLCFWGIAGVIIFFLLSSVRDYNLQNIFIFSLPTLKQLYHQSKPYIQNPLLPCLLLSAYNAVTFKKSRLKATALGITVGYTLLGLCVLGSVLLFGPYTAGRLDFPYSAAVSTVTLGSLFTRMDGISYLLYFACALTRTTVCGYVIIEMGRLIKGFTSKKL